MAGLSSSPPWWSAAQEQDRHTGPNRADRGLEWGSSPLGTPAVSIAVQKQLYQWVRKREPVRLRAMGGVRLDSGSFPRALHRALALTPRASSPCFINSC